MGKILIGSTLPYHPFLRGRVYNPGKFLKLQMLVGIGGVRFLCLGANSLQSLVSSPCLSLSLPPLLSSRFASPPVPSSLVVSSLWPKLASIKILWNCMMLVGEF
jgi:hypothetical protein